MTTKRLLEAARRHERRCAICRAETVRVREALRRGVDVRNLPDDGSAAIAKFLESYHAPQEKKS